MIQQRHEIATAAASELIEQNRTDLEALCRKFSVRELFLIGSATRSDFDCSQSDLDFIVEFEENIKRGFGGHYFGLALALEDLFQCKVDLIEYAAIREPRFLREVNETRVRLYAA